MCVRKIWFSVAATFLLNTVFTPRVKAQDIHFSQFYENAILRNPALTGIFSGDYKFGANYRSQWASIAAPFNTTLFSAETRILVNKEAADYVSFGVSGTYDQAGSIDFTSMQIYPAINYNKSLGDRHNTYFSMGMVVGYDQRSVDMSKMTFTSEFSNGVYTPNSSGERFAFTSVHYYDIGAGVSVNGSLTNDNRINYYVGQAAYHVTQPNESFARGSAFVRLSTRFSSNFGLKYLVNNEVAITVHANYTIQNPYRETIFGGLASWKAIGEDVKYNFVLYAGLFYRWNDAIIPTLKLDYKDYSLTLSYDINNSGLKPASNGAGGYEISLYVRGRFKKVQNVELRCPGFENVNIGNEFNGY
jgi:type IX secretion system PorP/SprF family membrane protein